MDRVEAERVDPAIAEPVERVLDEKFPHLVAVSAVEIERRPPGRLIAVGEVRPKVAEIIAFGTEMVVDDVEHDRETPPVAGVDQFF